MSFVHLHVHSNYSLLEGACRIEDLAARAAELKMPALALTDTRALYGAVDFYNKAIEAGIKPIIGTDMGGTVLLARNRAGYANLCRIISLRRLAPPEAFDLSRAIAENGEGLYVLSEDAALLVSLRERIEPRYLYYSLDALRLTSPYSSLPTLLQSTLKRLDIGFVATNDVHFLNPDDYEIHRVLSAIRENVNLASLPVSVLAGRQAYFRTADEMREIFRAFPEAVTNTLKIAEDCNLELQLGKPIFPHYELPEGETAYSFLYKLCLRGLPHRYQPVPYEAMRRLEYELDVINKLGFADYFVIVWDIVNYARSQGVPTVGRGSAANSLVAYLLGITRVDPLKYDLYFERFLNMSRTDCPDIDLDFCYRQRDKILEHIYRRYGDSKVAMIATHNTYSARSAFRDVARIMGLPMEEINRFSKKIPSHFGFALSEGVKQFPESRSLPYNDEPYKTIIRIAEKLDGFPRHLGIHVGGVVIGDRELTHYLPLERAPKGYVITQYEMNAVEALGLVKIDILGQRGLTVIAQSVKEIEKNHGVKIDTDMVPDRDPATAELMSSGRTIGCFQIESPAMRHLNRMVGVRGIDDIILTLALVRPGASGSGMKEHFIRRFCGEENITYLHPRLKRVLHSTLGIMLYQEDILKVAHEVAGFTLEEGDGLRKAITKKRSPERMAALERQFLDGAAENGVNEATANIIWKLVSNFASYSYCKAHAATYGHLAYQIAWLKAHYPTEFFSAILANEGGFYSTREYVEDARRCGVAFLPPDVNRSEAEATTERRHDGTFAIRIGLSRVRFLQQNTIDEIIRNRSFTSLKDFHTRVRAQRREIENLILCGAMDSLGVSRPTLIEQLERIVDGRTPDNVPSLPDYSLKEKLAAENDILDLSVTAHPLEYYREEIRKHVKDARYRRLIAVKQVKANISKIVTICGWLVTARRVLTKSDEYMKFITVEDPTGLVEATLFPDAYQRFGHLTDTYGPYLITGQVESQHGAITLTVKRLEVV